MRLRPFSTVIGVNGSRVLPLSRAWHYLANGPRSATPLSRPVGGYGYISRPPETMRRLLALAIAMVTEPQ